jgi:hypothetical protein
MATRKTTENQSTGIVSFMIHGIRGSALAHFRAASKVTYDRIMDLLPKVLISTIEKGSLTCENLGTEIDYPGGSRSALLELVTVVFIPFYFLFMERWHGYGSTFARIYVD